MGQECRIITEVCLGEGQLLSMNKESLNHQNHLDRDTGTNYIPILKMRKMRLGKIKITCLGLCMEKLHAPVMPLELMNGQTFIFNFM